MMRKLYIIVRTDLDSMTPGRIAAQCSHAANQFAAYSKQCNTQIKEAFEEWESQTNGHFGITIVLNGGTQENINNILENISGLYIFDTVIDPEYPIKDGNHTWIIPNVLTCAYAFCYGDEDIALKGLNLL